MQKKTVLFDLDGVLADTRDWVVTAFHHTAKTYHLDVTDTKLNDLFGRSLEESYVLLAPDREPEHATLIEAHREFQRRHPELIRPFPGVLDVLEWLREREVKMGIVSGRRHFSALGTMEALGLVPYFPVLVGGDDTSRQKPDPQPVQRALDLLDATPGMALMVGDAPADIVSGALAGCETCGALYGFVGAALLETRPTYTIGDIRELPGILTP